MSANSFLPALAVAAVAAFAAPPPASAAQWSAARPVERDTAREMACGPQAAARHPIGRVRIITGEAAGRSLFGPDDVVILNAGSSDGLAAGQEFFVRRALRDPFLEPARGRAAHVSIQTAGWVRLEQVGPAVSSARILHACDGITSGDYLEPFVLPVIPTPIARGHPDFSDPGRVLMGNERRHVGAAGALMVLNRGSNHDVRPGQRLTVFRPVVEGGPVELVAEATVITVSPATALVYIDSSRDAVYVGDSVAVHR
ncbi:MAG: hypothetical protein H0T05_01455 [Acidobacteria bacterium]|nr:hypothetical protein [Acidobacteriota bacterium]MBA3885957.1 hypothetical protein [Acidobacteriota bacterium]